MAVEDWFLSASERGNDDTELDRRHTNDRAWTVGNAVTVLIHGSDYFRRLHRELRHLTAGDWVHFTDWRGDPDERLDGPGTAVATVLADAPRRGVHVRGLVWRSHPDQAHFSEQENLHLVETINDAGGEVLLDERVRRGGCHHQKLFVLRHEGRPDTDVAFVGGIDLCHGRHDDAGHDGDPQAIEMDDRYGPTPAWHDVQIEVRGPAVGDLAHTFRERWSDPTPLDHHSPWRAVMRKVAREPRHPDPMPPRPPDPVKAGTHAVQVLRTYPAKSPGYPFARKGERSIARAYAKAIAVAQSLIYIEDQYLWSIEAAETIANELREKPQLRLVAVVPKHPDQDGRFSGPPNRIGQVEAIACLRAAGGERVAFFDLESPRGWPVYVHAKVTVIDDTWMLVGSDNLNRRSWTHDSELSCAVLDSTPDQREPVDPGGLGDGARVLTRNTRLRLWREHLGRHDDTDDADLVDFASGCEALERAAFDLDAWHARGGTGIRPAGRLRRHEPEPVSRWAQPLAGVAHRLLVDPDGRPWRMRLAKSL